MTKKIKAILRFEVAHKFLGFCPIVDTLHTVGELKKLTKRLFME